MSVRDPSGPEEQEAAGRASVGPLLARVVAQVEARADAGADDGVQLSYVPSSALGRERGLDLRWEANLIRRGEVVSYDNAGSPAEVLALVLDPPVAPVGAGDWDEVGSLLHRVAELIRRVPSEDAVVDLLGALGGHPDDPVRGWRPQSRWAWRVEATVGDMLDDPSPTFAWDGGSPSEVLRLALDDAAQWAPR